MTMAGPRSRRRPVLFLVIASVVTAVVLIAQGAASSKPNADEAVQAYLDQVRPGVQDSASQGSDFADVRTNAATLGRTAIDRRLDRLAGEVKSTLSSIDTLTPPPSMRVAQAYLVATLGVRAKAITEARPALDDALTLGASPAAAVSQLEAVGEDLDLGDQALGLFVDSLPSGSNVAPGAPWMTDATSWTPVQHTAFVDLLRSSASAQPVHELAMLAFQTDPPAVSIAADGTQTIPASPTMSVGMVIENVGNQPEENVTVMVILRRADGGIETLRDFINLAPGGTRAITLTPMPTTPGMSGRLEVEVLPVPGETNLASSSITVPVVFR
jgi:hypothetical protein